MGEGDGDAVPADYMLQNIWAFGCIRSGDNDGDDRRTKISRADNLEFNAVELELKSDHFDGHLRILFVFTLLVSLL